MSKCAVILAGGKGTRLRPYTVALPKPLMPIGDHPILEIIVKQLAQKGFTNIIMAVNHQADIIKAFFADGSKWNIQIEYAMEDKPLGTMGPLKNLRNLSDNFLVMNGDILTDLEFNTFYEDHCLNKNFFTISSFHKDLCLEYGVLDVNTEMLLVGFREKPVMTFPVSMGVYMLNREVINYIPNDREYGFDQLMIDLMAKNKPVSVIKHNGYWLDMGCPDDYAQAIDEFETHRKLFIND